MIDFPYKILQISDFLSNSEYEKLQTLVAHFYISADKFKLHYKSLTWTDRVVQKLLEINPKFYNDLLEKEYLSYNDFQFLVNFNKEYNFNKKDYFNFCMMYRENFPYKKDEIIYFFENEIETLFLKAYKNLLEHLFETKINENKKITFGHINVYPKNSFITDHTDETENNDRLFTTLFFINSDRKKEDGSLLKLYTENSEVEIIPDFKNVVIIEQNKYNYRHEVTENVSDRVRYSIYTPMNNELYNQLITK